jgi:hypothetical protein
VPKSNSFTSPLGLTWKVTLTLSALPPAPMICSLAVNVASPVLVLTLKLAPNQTAIGSLCRHSLTSHGDDGLDLSLSRPVRARLSSSGQTLLAPSGDGHRLGQPSPSVWCITTVGRPCRGRIGEIGVNCLLPIICLAE